MHNMIKSSIHSLIAFTFFSNIALAQESISFGFLFSPKEGTYNSSTWNDICNKITKYNTEYEDNDQTISAIHDGLDLAKNVIAQIKSDKTVGITILINIDPKIIAQSENIHNYAALECKVVNEEYESALWQSLQKEAESLVRYCENTSMEQFDYNYYFDAIKNIFNKAYIE